MRKFLQQAIMYFELYFLRMIVGTPARLYYGNEAGARVNREWKKESKNHIVKNAQAKTLSTQGFVALGYPFDSKLVNEIKRRFTHLISEQEQDGLSLKKREVKPAAMHIPEITELLNSEIKEIVESYFPGNFEVSHVAAWRNYYLGKMGEKRDFVSNLWHNDQSSVGTIKMFLFLSDGVTRTNGSTKVFSIKQTRKIMRTGFFQRNFIFGLARIYVGEVNNINYLEGDTGFSFIFNPQQSLHAAGLVTQGGYRDVAVITIRPSKEPLKSNWAAKVIEKDLAYMNRTHSKQSMS